MNFRPLNRANRLEGFESDDWPKYTEDELRERVLVLQAVADAFDSRELRGRRFSGERIAELLRMTGYRGHRAWLDAHGDDEPPTLKLVE